MNALQTQQALNPAGQPEELLKATERNVHLRLYLESLEAEGLERPSYVVQLSRDHRSIRRPNILYPIGDPLFIHIYSRAVGERLAYHPVEPQMPPQSGRLLELLEDAMAARIDSTYDFDNSQQQAELLRRLLRSVTRVDSSLGRFGAYRVSGKHPEITLHVGPETFRALEYILLKEKVGAGIIEPFLKDPYIEDISCCGVGPFFIEHKIFQSCVSTVGFQREEQLDDYVLRLSERIGRPVTFRRPIADATLPDGSRLNVVFTRDISRRGSNFTIRKFSDVPISILQLCGWKTLDYRMAAYLWMLLEEGMSVWVIGETASGKTTTVKALCSFIKPESKIVSIEDTPEIVVPHENWVREVTRESDDKSSSVQIFDLLKAALRQRPNYIIVGEIRGQEASVAFQAMQCVAKAWVATEAGPLEVGELYRRLAHGRPGPPDGEPHTVQMARPIACWVYSPERGLRRGRIRAVHRMPRARLIRVETDDGNVLRVTPNHKFLVSLGGSGRLFEASAEELLSAGGKGDLWIAKPEPPRRPAGRRLPAALSGGRLRSLRIRAGDTAFWYMLGRLLGLDLIRLTGAGEFVWAMRGLTSPEVRWRLAAAARVLPAASTLRLTYRQGLYDAELVLKAEFVDWLVKAGFVEVERGGVCGCRGRVGRVPPEARGPYLAGWMDSAWAFRLERAGRSPRLWLRAPLDRDGTLALEQHAFLCGLAELGLLPQPSGAGHQPPEDLAEGPSRPFFPAPGPPELTFLLDGVHGRPARWLANEVAVHLKPEKAKLLWALAEPDGAAGESLPLADIRLRWLEADREEAERLAVELWVMGVQAELDVLGGRRARLFLREAPRTRTRVLSVGWDGEDYTYDLTLEGGRYYVGGCGSAAYLEDTGHPVIATFHAGTVEKLIQRLTGSPIEIPKTYVDNLNAVVIQSAVRIPQTGRLERRVLSVNEILGYDVVEGRFNYIELFSWDPQTDSMVFRGEGSSYLLEQKIAHMKGISPRELYKVYGELEARREILELMAKHRLTDYGAVWECLKVISRRGITSALLGLRERGRP